MFTFGEKHPVLFEIILFVVAMIGAAVFTLAGNILYLHPDLSTSLGRIAIGAILFFIFRRTFLGFRFFQHLEFMLPALLFAVWNVFYNLSSGSVFGGAHYLVEGCITALAPALFEEVIFRMIFIYNLKKKGGSDLQIAIVSALPFALVHLTNLAGMDVKLVLLQVVYAFVIGLVFAAVYVKNGSLLQVMLAHFLTDLATRVYVEEATESTPLQLTIFVILLVLEFLYALWLSTRKQPVQE